MHGNDVRHVVFCLAIYGRGLAFNVFSFVPIHNNTRAMYLDQDCMQIPM